MPALTKAQITDYHEHGFVMLGKIMDDATLDVIRSEEQRLMATVGSAHDEDLANRSVFISLCHHHSAAFRNVATQGPHLDAVEQIVGEDFLLWYTQFVIKHPDTGDAKSEFPWHQDNGYGAITPDNNVTVWIALDDVTEENGCVWVVPGSHKQGLLDHQKKNDSWHLHLDVETDGIPAIMKAGEAVMFSGLTLHRSKLNHTNAPRRAMFMEYAHASSHLIEDQQALIHKSHTWMVRGQLPLDIPNQAPETQS